MSTPSVKPAEDLYQRGLAFYRAGNFARCRECVDQVLTGEPDHAPSLILKGMALTELDDPDEAVEVLERAVAKGSEDADAWHHLAIALTMAGERKKAVEAMQATLRYRPNNVSVLIDLGNLQFMLGRVEEALAALEQARQLRHGDLSILRNLAEMYASASRSEQALATNLEILELKPDDILATSDAAWLFLRLNRLDEAVAAFRTLRRIDPEQELYAVHGLTMTEIRRRSWRRALDLAIEATRLDRYDLTTVLLAFISSKLFGKSGHEINEKDLNARFEAEHREHRRVHAEGAG